MPIDQCRLVGERSRIDPLRVHPPTSRTVLMRPARVTRRGGQNRAVVGIAIAHQVVVSSMDAPLIASVFDA